MKKIVFIFFFVFFPLISKAQFSLSFSPQKFDLILFSGETFEGKIKISNPNEFPVPLSLEILPFSQGEKGELQFEKIEKDSPVFWFFVEKKEMILAKKETKRISFEIKVPQNAPPGTYFVFLLLKPHFPKEHFEKLGPKVVPILGIPFLISVRELSLESKKKPFEVLSFSIPEKERIKTLEFSFNFLAQKAQIFLFQKAFAQSPQIFFTKKTPNSFLVKIKNNDVYYLKPKGKVIIYDIFGKKVAEGKIASQTLFPKKEREFEVKIERKNVFLLGRAELEIEAQSPVFGKIFPEKIKLNFFCLNSLMIVFAFFAFFLLIFFAKKRIKLALKVLFKLK